MSKACTLLKLQAFDTSCDPGLVNLMMIEQGLPLGLPCVM